MVGSRVYVGGLPYGVRERDLERFFKGYGRTRDILIKNGYGFVEFDDYRDADDAVYELNGKELLGERVIVEAARGHARGNGYGRDRYDDRYGRRGRYGDKVSVERARGTPRGSDQWRNDRRGGSKYPPQRRRSRDKYGPPTRTEYRLTVENLSSRVSWQDLKDYMRQAGEVTYADAHKQRRNEGVVEFATLADMKTAIEKLDDTDLNGRRIRLIEDRRRGGGGGRRSRSSSSRSRSRSRRRSRSRSRSSHSRSRSRSRGKSKSKSPARSRSRDAKSHDRSKSKSRSRSASAKRDDSRSPSKSKAKSLSRDRSHSRSRSRSRSGSKGNSKSKSRSVSPTKNDSPDRNESMED
uniref:Putative serine/arginine-rich splicing factor 6 n=1 Tax=Xenopsylla cheopis TaxID=163159 RepID=A0A6M2DSV8_XENCH